MLLLGGICGLTNHKSIDLIIEINDLSSPYYKIGISFIKYMEEDFEELTFGALFINIIIRFYK